MPTLGSHLITAANFCADGKFAVAGTYDGRCIFYDTEVRRVGSNGGQHRGGGGGGGGGGGLAPKWYQCSR